MQIKDVDKLKAWLLKKLEPLCDADPAALAKYVVALLRKEKPKSALRELCIDQLEVFLAKETTVFVEKLFRCLDTESYIKGEDPPPAPPPQPSLPSASQSLPVTTPSSLKPGRGEVVPSAVVTKVDSGGSDRRQSEDTRRKEVDEDDRDFRRSKRHEPEAGGGGGGGGAGMEVTRKIIAPIVPGPGTGKITLGKKRNFNNSLPDGGVSSSSKRRVVIDHSRDPDIHHRGVGGANVSSSTGPGGSGRRPVRERLGPRPDENRSDRGRHTRGGRSSQSSSSSSSSDSDSDTSSTESSSRSNAAARKRQKISGPVGGGGSKGGGGGGGGEGKKRQRCKDYDKKGFCILGESCPYDHGLDPLVIGGAMDHHYVHAPPGGVPPMGVHSQPPPELLAPPTIPPSGRISPPNSKAESYNPEEPGLGASNSTGFIPTHIAPPPPLPGPMRPMFPPSHMRGFIHPHNPHVPPFPRQQHHRFPPGPMIPNHFHHPPPHMMPRPPFSMGNMRPGLVKPSDSLIIRKIPKELNTITKLSSHFERFGTIVNLTVRFEGDLEGALVQFSSPSEAKKAHDNTEAVLNNRFIKIYYLRKDEFMPPHHHPQLKEFTLEAPIAVAVSTINPASASSTSTFTSSVVRGSSMSAVSSSESLTPVQPTPDSSGGMADQELAQKGAAVSMNHINKKVDEVKTVPQQSKPDPAQNTPTSSVPSHHYKQQQHRKSVEAAKKNLEIQKKAQELLHKQIGQQKLLISKLEKTGKHLSVEEKSDIMKSLKLLSKSISDVTNKTAQSKLEQQNSMEKDQKLEWPRKQQQTKAIQKEALKEKAEALRKEAHKLGLISSPSQPLPTAGGRGGGGGGGQQGKKGSDLRSKLHSKPRQLLVIGAKERDQLTSYFESFGNLNSVTVDPENSNNLIFTFRNSSTANQVAKSSSTFKGKPLIMKWYSPKQLQPPPTSIPTLTSHPHQMVDSSVALASTGLERQDSEILSLTTPTLTKLDPQDLHLVEDSDEEEDAGEDRSWRRR